MEKRKQVEKNYCFCYDGKILLFTKVSSTKKVVEEVPYCKICFLRILAKLWHRKHYPAPDMWVKDALEAYTNAKLYKFYKGRVLSDDDLFCRLRDWVKKEFAQFFDEAQEARHNTNKCNAEGHRRDWNASYEGRERHYAFRRKPGACSRRR